MTYLKLNGEEILAISYVTPKDLSGWTAYDGEMPEAKEGYHFEYKGGKVVAVSDRDASAERRAAYEAECDPLSMAYVGYMLEGNEIAAAECKAQYLTKKAEIRERIPDEEVEQ